MNDMLFTNKTNTTKLIILAVFYGIFFAVLFCFCGFGLNVPLYTASVIAGTGWALSKRSDFKPKVFFPASACVFALSLVYFLRLNYMFWVINMLLLPLIYILSVCLSLEGSAGIISRFFTQAFVPIGHMDKLIRTFSGMLRGDKTSSKNVFKALWGVLAACALLIIIIPLMRSADSAFAFATKDMFRLGDIPSSLLRIVIGLAVALYAFGFVYACFFNRGLVPVTEETAEYYNRYAPKVKTLEEKQNSADSSASAVMAFLVCLLCIFAVFCGFQVVFLFLKVSSALPSDFDYAEYARSGVFSLWALTAINLCIVLVSRRRTEYVTRIKQAVFRAVHTLFTLCNLLMTVAAAYKMSMYISQYGYTRARLLVMMYLVFQFAALLVLTASLYVKKIPFIKTAVAAMLVCYCVTGLVNIDACVARLMIKRYEKIGEIDYKYLSAKLSDDAFITAASWLEEKYGVGFKSSAEQTDNTDAEDVYIYYLDESASDEEMDVKLAYRRMSKRLDVYRGAYGNTDWRCMNLTRIRIVKVFE